MNLIRSRSALAIAAPLLAAACTQGPEVTVGERVATELVEVWRTGDVAAAEAIFDPLATYTDRATGDEARGAPEVIAFVLGVHTWSSSVFVEVDRIVGTDDFAAIEWAADGTIPPEDPDGEPSHYRVEGVTLLDIRDGRIMRAVDYSDPTAVLVARGGAVVFPDGTRLERSAPSARDTVDSGG